jgi:Helix-turn-helix
MGAVRDLIRERLSPTRQNDLEARRKQLGLSRVALGRILGVDPATIFRRERGPLAALFDYAMRGVEAEAENKSGKQIVRNFRKSQRTIIPEADWMAARGYGYIAEQMRDAQEQRRKPRAQTPLPDAPASKEKARIKAMADRAEATAKARR